MAFTYAYTVNGCTFTSLTATTNSIISVSALTASITGAYSLTPTITNSTFTLITSNAAVIGVGAMNLTAT